MHHLIHLIHRTAPTTLWIIVMNDKASRVLDAGAQLSRAFSHRINAMSVSWDDLEKAILERHRLSGLQLEFAPPPAGDPRVSRAKMWMGLAGFSAEAVLSIAVPAVGGRFPVGLRALVEFDRADRRRDSQDTAAARPRIQQVSQRTRPGRPLHPARDSGARLAHPAGSGAR